jgi:hypothetical protein
MIDSHDPPRTIRGNFDLLSHDLAAVYGTLSEITAVWRRAHQDWPELPLRLPLQLQDATRQLAVSAQALVDAGPGQSPELAFWLARRLSALRNDIRVARALTREAAIGVGDAALWDHLGEPLRRAGNRLLLLIVQLARIKEWSLSGPDGELSEPDQAVLVIQLG